MKKLRILVLMHEDLVPPESTEGLSEAEIQPFKTEYDVTVTLQKLGHDVRPLGVQSDLGVIRDALVHWKPDLCFNLLEEFHGQCLFDQHVVSFLELMRQPYTGCNPRGLTLAHDKALSKKILAYHRIPVPGFATFPMGRKVRRPRKLEFPLLVKSLTAEGSVGIAQSSVVHNDDSLTERVEFVHRKLQTDAIAEQYIEGRELYVGIMGNQRLQTLPVWELLMHKLPKDAPNIATERVKWSYKHQEKLGVESRPAKLEEAVERRVLRQCKRAYQILGLTGYARMDLRLAEDGKPYLIEANPNPQLAYGEDFSESAHKIGISYEKLLTRIVSMGMRYRTAADEADEVE
jgi:D-alanine-D-alanine ligase